MPQTPVTESWIARAARLHPGRLAIDAPDGQLTTSALNAASATLAGELLVEGIRRRDEVAIALPSGAAFAVALHACLRAGFIAVPEDLRLPDARRAERRVGTVATIDDALATRHLARAAGGASAPRPPAAAGTPLAGRGSDAPTPAIRLTTSGTTGPGTPVHLSRGALLWNALGSAVALGQPPHERWLSAMPVSHVGGLTVLVRSAVGATCAVVRPQFSLAEQVALLQAGAATITSVVPTTLSRLLDAGLDHPPVLRLVLLGGAPIPPELLARAQAAGVTVASTYGLSEACSQVLTHGWPLFCTTVVLAGELPPSADANGTEADELLVRSPTLATGVTAADGWLHTGDRGRRLPDGALQVIGRIAETIVTGGENVAPSEVESQLVALPGVTDAAVLGITDPEWGERLEARVVLAPGQALDEDALRAALRGVLPGFAVPKRITSVDALPRTPTGKLVRRELR